MATTADCPQCHCKLAVDDEQLGKRLRCPKCGTSFAFAPQAAPPPVRGSPPRLLPNESRATGGPDLAAAAKPRAKPEPRRSQSVLKVKPPPRKAEMAPDEFISTALELPSQRPPLAAEEDDDEATDHRQGTAAEGGQDYALSQALGLVSMVLAGMGYVLVTMAQDIVLYLGVIGLGVGVLGIVLGKKRKTPIKQAVIGAVVCAGVIATSLIMQYYMQQQLGGLGGIMNLLKGVGGGGGGGLGDLEKLLK